MPLPKVGFEFRETMSGSWTPAGKPDQELPIRFTLHAVCDDARSYLKDQRARIDGTLEMEGFADEAALSGTLVIAPVFRRIIRYEFGFVGNDGQPYRLVGQKDVRLSDLLGSMTTLPAQVVDKAGQPVARVSVRFDVKADLLTFLASWKPRLATA